MNKTVKTLLIFGGALLGIGGYMLYRKKSEEKKKSEEFKRMQQKYNQINSVDDFLEGVKYLDETTQYGYDFTKLYQKKDELEKMPFDKLKRLYELAKKGQVGLNSNSRTAKEDEEFLQLINIARRQYFIYP